VPVAEHTPFTVSASWRKLSAQGARCFHLLVYPNAGWHWLQLNGLTGLVANRMARCEIRRFLTPNQKLAMKATGVAVLGFVAKVVFSKL
jgi:hypothetical protein